MDETVRLGTIAGIRVGVNWSVLLIFALLFAALSFGRFPLLYPDRAPAAYLVAGAVAAVVFLASLLAHELAHAVVARHHGLEVEGITLWLLGGAAKLGGDAPDPVADLRIAAVGPLVSLTLGAVFGALWTVAPLFGLGELAGGVLGWLASINVVLAVFNLIPAAPLDGGRVLRALLWRHHGDRVRADLTAARAGRRFGAGLVGLGVALFLFAPGAGGLWFVLLGWFLASAARAEEQHTQLRHSLRALRVADVMTPDPVTVPTGTPVATLLEELLPRHRCSAFPVVDRAGHPVGLVTLHRLTPVPAGLRPEVAVDTVACPAAQVPHAAPSDRLLDVLSSMATAEDGRLLVVDGGRVVGIVTPTDVTRAFELQQLREQLHHRATGPDARPATPPVNRW